jgi:hypothetical protein
MLQNTTYYPTPNKLIKKMWGKVKNKGALSRILEPSAGQGNIVEFLSSKDNSGYSHRAEISCIEIDTTFQASLREKKFKVIDSNFLAYSGTDRFDLIIANPPFDDGCDHLMKAIDIMYSGQIVFLLNAETLKNPFSNQRKVLVQRLNDLNADIEYISNAFIDAERKTGVEVALVYISIERNVEDDLFKNCKDIAENISVTIEQDKDIISGNSISSKVELYNDTLQTGLKTIENYYRNYNKIGEYLALNTIEEKKHYLNNETLNQIVNDSINSFVIKLRKNYWKSILDLDEVISRMTRKKIDEFNYKIEEYSFMDFTESNIKSFILSLIGNYENVLTEAVADIFDRMTVKHCWHDETSKNIHYFNGWKTNKSFYCNEKVILPIGSSYSHPFIGYSGEWRISRYDLRELDDIDKVMNYFDGTNEYVSIVDALEKNIATKTSRIESTYFTISVFKKKTIHLTFRSEDIRRRFNVVACRHKKWLPEDYGKKSYNDMTIEEKDIVGSFEGKDSYNKNVNQIEFVNKNVLKLS